jgi:DNA-binding GntR family transcriptional regulator
MHKGVSPAMAERDSHENDELLSRGALRHQLVRRLLVEIFEGKLPAGARLIVMNLAERFGLSSTPVREALLELEANGMVHFVHNRGAVVKPFGPEQLGEIFQLRRILESESTRLACGHIESAILKELRQELLDLSKQRRGKQWLDAEMAADRKLHTSIAEGCGNSRLAEETRRCDTLVQALRDVVGNDRIATHEAVEEHLAIVDAMIAGKADAAAAAMSSHIERAGRSAEKALFAKGASR